MAHPLALLSVWALVTVAVAPGIAASSEPVNLGRFDFEQPSLPDWIDDQNVAHAVVSADGPHGGAGALHLDMGARTGVLMHFRHAFGLPALGRPRTRTIRLGLWVRSENLGPGELGILFLKGYGEDRYEWLYQGYQDYRNNRFATLPVSSEWTWVQADGAIDPEVRTVSMYVAAGNQSGNAKVWIDDVSVDLLDRGLLLARETRGNLYEGESATLRLLVSGADDLQSGAVSLLDEEGRSLGGVDLQPGREEVAVPLVSRGYYDIRASAAYADGTRSSLRTTAAVAGPDIPEALRRSSAFGLCGADDELLARSGARWDRTFFSLRREDYRRAAEAGSFDERVPARQAVVRSDRDMIYCLCEQPDWLQGRVGQPPSSRYFPPADWAAFPAFIRYVARSIEGHPQYVEVANEPDEWQGSSADFVRYSRQMGEAVKSVNPTARLLGPAFCNIDLAGVKPVVEAGLLDVVDIFSIHPYINGTEPEGEYIRRIRELKSYLASVGREDLPICLSEYGWTLPPGDWQRPVEPPTQAQYVSRSSILLVAEEIDTFIYFLAYPGGGPTCSYAGYALLNWDYTPRPGFAAFANAARMLTGVSGPGRCLQLTPTAWLALFQKGPDTLAVAWDTAGRSAALIPTPWKSARDMMGRPVGPPATGLVDISPSPLFVEVPGLDLYRIAQAGEIRAPRGTTVALPWEPRWAPAALPRIGEGIRIPPDAPRGQYHVIGHTPEGWQAVEVLVQPALEPAAVETVWPLGDPEPTLQVRLRSNLAQAARPLVAWHLPGVKSPAPTTALLAPQATDTISLRLGDYVPGRRYRGHVSLQSPEPSIHERVPLEATVVPCLPYGDGTRMPEVDFSAWAPFDAQYQEVDAFAPSDCSGRLQIGYDEQGLHVRVAVTDDHHLQQQGAGDMWREDSLQIALDMDAEQPWVANIGGFSGHQRVYEYGFALGEGGPMSWRWISYDKALPADVEDGRVVVDIQRGLTETTYELRFPWETLNLSSPPAAGSRIGVAVAVNDIDPEAPRHGLRLFGGLVDGKDPATYGALWMR